MCEQSFPGDRQLSSEEADAGSESAENGSKYLRGASPDKQRCVLKEVGYADRSDEHRKRSRASQRPVRQPLDKYSESSTDDHGKDHRHPRRQIKIHGCAKRNIRADHDNVSMGEVQHLGDAVYHCVAQSYDSVNAAKAQAVDKVG